MKKVDHLVARAFKSAMAFVLAVGLCPVAPAMAQEGATANEEGGVAAAAVDGADVSTDGAVAPVRLAASRARRPTACSLAAFPAMAMLRRMALVLALPGRTLLKMMMRVLAFRPMSQKRLPRPMGKPTNPTKPPPRPTAGRLGAAANGWLTPKAA